MLDSISAGSNNFGALDRSHDLPAEIHGQGGAPLIGLPPIDDEQANLDR